MGTKHVNLGHKRRAPYHQRPRLASRQVSLVPYSRGSRKSNIRFPSLFKEHALGSGIRALGSFDSASVHSLGALERSLRAF